MAATLPSELIEDIGKRLDTKSDVSRFRAVCRSWRSSIPPVDLELQTFHISICDERNKYYKSFSVSETGVSYHHLVSCAINPDQVVKRDWLVRVSPLFEDDQVINLLDFQGFELARAYSSKSVSKFVTSTNHDFPDIMLISNGWLCHGKLGREQTYVNVYMVDLIDYDASGYEDVIFDKGMFYAVTQDGRAIAVDDKLTKVPVVFPISRNLDQGIPRDDHDDMVLSLVESSGDLLLVERLWGRPRNIKAVKYKVYKLNVVEKQWVEMQASDLRDRILLVLSYDEHFSFSVPAKGFLGCQGNCIYFNVHYDSRLRVFDLSSGTVSNVDSA